MMVRLSKHGLSSLFQYNIRRPHEGRCAVSTMLHSAFVSPPCPPTYHTCQGSEITPANPVPFTASLHDPFRINQARYTTRYGPEFGHSRGSHR